MVNVNMSEGTLPPLSESIQMYLVVIARLRVDDQPVPLSDLAEELSLSVVSVNEMCRKLQDQGLLIYRPYKGAFLTEEGERRAYFILRRHRLWEVFLVERLGFAYLEAHEAACQLEHSTPSLVADRLDAFLEYPTVNPLGQPIPRPDGTLPAPSLVPLTTVSVGQCGHVVRCEAEEAAQAFLDEQGVRPGVTLRVMATAKDSLLVQFGETRISLARSLAELILVEPKGKEQDMKPSPKAA